MEGLEALVLCYNPDDHSVSSVGPLPPGPPIASCSTSSATGFPRWCSSSCSSATGWSTSTAPGGGRFALIEVGHAAQNLTLRVTAEGLAGCEVGATVDRPPRALLDLDGTLARVALAYACGLA